MARSTPPSRDPASTSSERSITSSRTATFGGRVQRDVRLQAALALLVGIALVAVPLFIWGRGRNKSASTSASTSASLSSDDAGPPTVIFGDAGASVTIDAGGRPVAFGEARYVKCQDPGPGKTAPEQCDHLGPIEELVTKTIAEKTATCMALPTTSQIVNVVVDVSFKKKRVVVKAGKDGSTMPAKDRTKAIACMMKGMAAPNWDTVGHAHQRYLFQFLTTFGAGAPVAVPSIPPPPPGPTVPP